MQRTVPTTTLLVEKPVNFDRLEAEFKLIRYELPSELRWRKNKNDYGQMHNSLRDQLDYPYRTFKHDRLDRGIPKWVVYVLYPRNEIPKQLALSFIREESLKYREISFADLELHLLLKLLQIAYFRGVKGIQAGRFVGQDFCYVYAQYDKKKGIHICLEIELKGDIRNQPEDSIQTFKIIGHARPFARVESTNWQSYAYFGSRIREQKRYFLHLKRSEINQTIQANEPIYRIRTHEKQRTTLAYHNLQRIEASVGKILYDFIHSFSAYLARYGISCSSKERAFIEFKPPKNDTPLPLTQLSPIQVYDNRLERKHPLQEYIKRFEKLWPELRFLPINDLSQEPVRALLVVQDHQKEDFEDGGVLQEKIDPYLDLYYQFRTIPKQSINVNTNEVEGKTSQQYLDYSLPSVDDDLFKQKVEVALSQLYLKDVIFYERSVQQYLPLAPKEFVFIRKGRNASDLYETLLYFENDTLRFLDLRDPDALDQRDQLLRALGIDWEVMYDQMLRKYRKTGENEEAKDLPSYNVIIGQDLFIEVEGLDERILYNYDEIVKRQEAIKTPLPIDALKLLSYYNKIFSSSHLSYEDLQHRGLLNAEPHPKNERERESLAFYQQLEQYDAFLDEIARTHVEISYEELTKGELWEEIIRIFGYKKNKNGLYSRRPFKALYQEMGWFSSDKAKELQLYEGIWYDNENSYMVGSTQAMKLQQPRAHLIRRFDIYTGADHFNIEPLLLATSVQFVRLNQYTVYPYAFHLIDIYVENVLRFQ